MMPTLSWETLPLYLAGYIYSIFIASWIISPIITHMWHSLRDDCTEIADIRQRYTHLAEMLGMVERALYSASIQFGKPEFIAVWLALKVAGSWRLWSETDTGRVILSVFLIGNALSVAYGVVGGILPQKMKELPAMALVVASVLIVASLLFWLLVAHRCKVSERATRT